MCLRYGWIIRFYTQVEPMVVKIQDELYRILYHPELNEVDMNIWMLQKCIIPELKRVRYLHHVYILSTHLSLLLFLSISPTRLPFFPSFHFLSSLPPIIPSSLPSALPFPPPLCIEGRM